MEPNFDQVIFYTGLDFKGDHFRYKTGSDVTFWNGDGFNDTVLSVKVGIGAKLICFQHSDGGGIKKEYGPGHHADLRAMLGLSKFQILPVEVDFGVALKLVDATAANTLPGAFVMTFAASGLESVNVPSNLPEPTLLPAISSDASITCAIYVRHMKSGAYLDPGSIYFHWSAALGMIYVTTSPSTFPSYLSYKQIDRTAITFYLNDIPDFMRPPVIYASKETSYIEGDAIEESAFLTQIEASTSDGSIITTNLNGVDLSAPGRYTVQLRAENTGGLAEAFVGVTIVAAPKPQPPVIESDDRIVLAKGFPLTEAEFLARIEARTSDGSPITTNLSPGHFISSGSYLVKLTARNAAGTSEKLVTLTVIAATPPIRLIEQPEDRHSPVTIFITVNTEKEHG